MFSRSEQRLLAFGESSRSSRIQNVPSQTTLLSCSSRSESLVLRVDELHREEGYSVLTCLSRGIISKRYETPNRVYPGDLQFV